MELKELKAKAQQLKPALRIGKSGLTDSVIEEIKAQLKKKKLIKIKLLKSVLAESDKKNVIDELLEKTNAILVSKVGFVVTLHKGIKKS